MTEKEESSSRNSFSDEKPVSLGMVSKSLDLWYASKHSRPCRHETDFINSLKARNPVPTAEARTSSGRESRRRRNSRDGCASPAEGGSLLSQEPYSRRGRSPSPNGSSTSSICSNTIRFPRPPTTTETPVPRAITGFRRRFSC